MFDQRRLLYIHGLAGTSTGAKALLLRERYPQMLIPDFTGLLHERMHKLRQVIGNKTQMTIIGSSLGGLMAAWYTVWNSRRVRRLVLLAPALIWIDFAKISPCIKTPTVIYHGRQDTIVPLAPVREYAEKLFLNLEFIEVDDDHGLYKTAQSIDWAMVLER